MSAVVTDETCIAIAVLHGAEFWGHGDMWHVNVVGVDGLQILHPIEQAQTKATGESYFPSREAIARAYCEYHNLLR